MKTGMGNVAPPEPVAIPARRVSHALRRVFGSHAAAVHRLMDADPDFAKFLARQDIAGIHFLALAVSYEMPNGPDELRALGGKLRTVERRKMIWRILGRKPPAGLTGVLGKLRSAPMPAQSYRTLVELLYEPMARKALTHTHLVSKAMIDGLAHLPLGLRIPKLARIVGNPEDRARFYYALAAVRRKRPELDVAALRVSLKAVKCADDIRLWLDHLLTRLPFAAPPWAGDELLRPIRGRQELREAAKRFSNCLADYMLDAALGRKFFYVWEGEEACVVEVCPDDLVGWRIGDIEGADRRKPASETRAVIVARFARNGVLDFGEGGFDVWVDFL